MKTITKVKSKGSRTGIIDTWVVYGNFFARCGFGDVPRRNDQIQKRIYKASAFNPVNESNLYSKLRECEIFETEEYLTKNEFIQICEQLEVKEYETVL